MVTSAVQLQGVAVNLKSTLGGVTPTGFTAISSIFFQNITVDFGTVVILTGLTATTTVTGLLTTDQVQLECVGVLNSGVAIANVRVSLADTLEVRFNTTTAGNQALGSLNYRLTVIRP